MLEHIPKRYYQPQNEFEHSVITCREKLPVKIYESEKEASLHVCIEIATAIRKADNK